MTERFVSYFPLPTPRQRELLTCLVEEMAETTQRITKAFRFGLAEMQTGQDLTNAERIAQELGDVLALMDLLIEENVLREPDILTARIAKRLRLGTYLQTDPDRKDTQGS